MRLCPAKIFWFDSILSLFSSSPPLSPSLPSFPSSLSSYSFSPVHRRSFFPQKLRDSIMDVVQSVADLECTPTTAIGDGSSNGSSTSSDSAFPGYQFGLITFGQVVSLYKLKVSSTAAQSTLLPSASATVVRGNCTPIRNNNNKTATAFTTTITTLSFTPTYNR